MHSGAKNAILITGAGSGIGQATAWHLTAQGYHVFAGVRREGQNPGLAGNSPGGVTPLLLDVTVEEHVSAAFHAISEHCRKERLRFAGLVNNAGIAISGPLEDIPLDQVRAQFEVTVFGALALIQAFLPLLRDHTGRVVNIGTGGCHLAPPFLGPYVSAKIAMEAINDVLRRELRPWRIHVANIVPGAIETPIWQKGMSAAQERFNALPESARDRYGTFFTRGLALMTRFRGRAIRPEAVARVVRRALEDRRPKLHYRVGTGSLAAFLIPRLLPQRLGDIVTGLVLGSAPRT